MSKKYFERKIKPMAPIGAKLIGFIFIVLGFFAVLGGFYLAILLCLMGSFVVFTYTGVQIDMEAKTYREFNSFLGLKFGSFSKLPALSHITVYNHASQYSNNLMMGGAQAFSTETSCRISLKGKNKRFSLPVSNGSKQKVMDDAHLLSEIFLLDIVDITGPEKKVYKIDEPTSFIN